MDGKRLAGMLAALGLLAALILSCLRLLELTDIEEALTSAARQLDLADVEGAADNLASVDEADLTETQGSRRDEILSRLLTVAFSKRSPLVSVASHEFRDSDAPIWVASLRPHILVSVQPPALRGWVREVRLGSTVLHVTRDGGSYRARLPELHGVENVLPIDVVYRAPGGQPRSFSTGSVSISVDASPPVVTVDLGSSTRKFDSPSEEETQIQVRPGSPPSIAVEDPMGLTTVRWVLDGIEASASVGGKKRWELPLDRALFEKSGRDLSLVIKPMDHLGNKNQVALRFAIR